MPAKFRSEHDTIHTSGVDHDTPEGYSTALGTDSLGTVYLWLFKGEEPTDETFIGSIMIPRDPGASVVAYGQGGGYFGVVENTAETLAKLAAANEK